MKSYSIRHQTTYRYQAPVACSHHVARLHPVTNQRQTLRAFELAIEPSPDSMGEREDYFGNRVRHFSIEKPHQELSVTSEARVQVHPLENPLLDIAATVAQVRETLERPATDEVFAAVQFTHPSTLIPVDEPFGELARRFLPDDGHYLGGALALARHIYETFEFDSTATDVTTSVYELLKLERGVCQDFAHFAIACLRSLGLPVRYVSGYLLTDPPAGMPRLAGADASHAWISIFDPDLGWIDIDPTNNLICGDQHIVIGHGRDFQDVSLLSGAVTGGGRHFIEVAVTVAPAEAGPAATPSGV